MRLPLEQSTPGPSQGMGIYFMIKVLYEDNHLIAVKKPAGILVQAGDKDKVNLLDEVKKYLKDKYNKEGNVFLGLVHRLDKPVSGIVVFAKTSKGASRLSEQFRNREVKKIYTAIVEGELKSSGHLIHFLKKDPDKLVSLVEKEEKKDFQKAELSYIILKSNKNSSLIEINLKTGRFNQIRAQFSHIGHPIMGDKLYNGSRQEGLSGIGLCATEIEFKTATTDEIIKIKIDYPKEWNGYLN